MKYTPNAPKPTPRCAAFEPLLPLLGTDALTSDETRASEEHIGACAWCQAQRAAYTSLDAAARRHYSPDTGVAPHPPLRLEDIMRADEAETPLDTFDLSDDDDSALEVSAMTLDPPARQKAGHHAGRGRLRLLGEVAAVVVVALLATTLVVNRLGLLGGGPTQPLKTSAGAVVFVHSVSWGRLQLNGQTVSVATDGYHPLYLPRGQNTLTYAAPPLPVMTCTISAPAAPGDTCAIFHPDPASFGPNGQSYNGRMVDLKAVPDRLSQTQREALATAAQRSLDALTVKTIIQPGDHYLTPEGKTLTATQLFPVTLSYHLDATGVAAIDNQCIPFCGVTLPTWSITPTISWDYVDQYGKAESVVQQGDSMLTSPVVNLVWNGSWQVSVRPEASSQVVCGIGVSVISQFVKGENGWGAGCGGRPVSQLGGILIETSFSTSSSVTDANKGYVLYRAGALIALDANAHSLVPTLPGPNAHELEIARQLGFNG